MAVMSDYAAGMLAGYETCALWSSLDDAGNPLDDAGYELAPETEERFRADCERFMAENENTLLALKVSFRNGMQAEQVGHDLWLTRNGHGAGFWDRGLGEVGERLTEAARAMGTCDLYVGDDGLIYAA